MTTRRGFSLIELLVVIACLALVIALLLPGLATARRAGRLAVCFANLHQDALATPAYAADFRDRIWTFSWRATSHLSEYPDLNAAGSDCEAAANQAVDILRHRTDRPGTPIYRNWTPYLAYSHLVLVDYLSGTLPERTSVCPEDRRRRVWQADPQTFGNEPNGPPLGWRPLGYSSSYQVAPFVYDTSPPGSRVEQVATACDGFMIPNGQQSGGHALSEVWYPTQKVHVYDRHERHFSPPDPFFGLTRCREPLLFFDGSVVNRRSADANPGWQPNNPACPDPTIVYYIPEPWDEPTLSHGPFDQGPGRYRWTRAGLAGIDFDGSEILTGQSRR